MTAVIKKFGTASGAFNMQSAQAISAAYCFDLAAEITVLQMVQ